MGDSACTETPRKCRGLPLSRSVLPRRFDGAEPDAVGHALAAGLDRDVVELGSLRRPQREVRIHRDRREAVGVGHDALRDAGLGNVDGDLLLFSRSIEAHPAGDARLRSLLELHEVVLHEGIGDIHDFTPRVSPP